MWIYSPFPGGKICAALEFCLCSSVDAIDTKLWLSNCNYFVNCSDAQHWFWSKQYQNNQNALEFTIAENFISYVLF